MQLLLFGNVLDQPCPCYKKEKKKKHHKHWIHREKEKIWNFSLSNSVYHICNFIFFPSNSIVLILKSIPAPWMKLKGEKSVISYYYHHHKSFKHSFLHLSTMFGCVLIRVQTFQMPNEIFVKTKIVICTMHHECISFRNVDKD